MSFFEFPNTRTYDSDLGWLIKAMEELIVKVDTFIDVNKIKFADPITWDITKQYAANTIVISADGEGYISRKNVPAGVTLDQTGYWTKLFDFSELLKVLRHQIAANDDGSSTTATFASTTGELVWLNNILYKAVENISIGTAYVDGENIEHVTIEGLLSDIDTKISSIKERKIILIGDSYMTGDMSTGITIQTQINLFCNATTYNYGYGGSGFVTGDEHSFYNRLVYAISQTTDKRSITDVLVAGGYNDPVDTQKEAFLSSINAIVNLVRNELPNAKLWIAPLMWTNDDMPLPFYQKYTQLMQACYDVGCNVLNNVPSFLFRIPDCISSDGIHPNSKGYFILGCYLASWLNGTTREPYFTNAAILNTTAGESVNFTYTISNGLVVIKGYFYGSHSYGVDETILNLPDICKAAASFIPVNVVNRSMNAKAYSVVLSDSRLISVAPNDFSGDQIAFEAIYPFFPYIFS